MARRNAGEAIGELSFLRPGKAPPEVPAGPELEPAAPETAPAAPQPVEASEEATTPTEASPRPRRRKRKQVNVRTELDLPEDLLFRARSMVRPQHTGAARSLGAAFVVSAYVIAVDELIGGNLDVSGIDQDGHEELIERIKRAIG